MWLLHITDTDTIELEEFADNCIPPYAILSHTWGPNEVLFEDMHPSNQTSVQLKEGYVKLRGCCTMAKSRGFEYAWIDTCCIDKRSSAELSEAINSMYRWYQAAKECYVYPADVSREGYKAFWWTRYKERETFFTSKWFIFFNRHWVEVGTKVTLCYEIAKRTRSQERFLRGQDDLDTSSVAQRMAWAAGRETTRIEDRAYSLLGIFGIHHPVQPSR
ncbi:HET-domain-containing protein [Podospora australis]|uniref:HET-domain-containing protein n=1 Tax=Podospora australis TaxID=1536484 RepID=A0AAN6WQS0_9PEZI|nr:HET-domain-containing protein [Podospora australis]